MIRKLFCSMFVMVVAISFVAAEEFTANISAVKDGKVTLQKMKGGGKGKTAEKDGDPITLPVTKDAVIAKAKGFGKKTEAGDKIEDGLKNDLFTKIDEKKGVNARITTDADNKNITQILVVAGKKKKDAE
jgi:hypothetical protein